MKKSKSLLPPKKASKLNYNITLSPPPKQEDTSLDPLLSEIQSLQFLMTPRILFLSLKNQQSIPYITQLTLMPKSITPFLENYIFEWKSVETSKTVNFLSFFYLFLFNLNHFYVKKNNRLDILI